MAVWKIYLKKGSDKFSVTYVQKFTVLIWAKFESGKKTLSFFFKKRYILKKILTI